MIQSTVRLLSVLKGGLAAVMIVVAAGCGQTAPAPAPAAKPAPTLTLIEPADGATSGHIDLFRWSAAEGADGYVVRILGSDGRVVFESPSQTATEAHLPKTVALEPEAHTWNVTARKGGDVLVASPVFKFTITP